MMKQRRAGVGGIVVWLACGLACSSSERWPDGAAPGMDMSAPAVAAPTAPAPDPAPSSGATASPAGGGAMGSGEAVGDPELPLAPSSPAPSGPATARFLSELCAASEQNGWGPIERDRSNGEQDAGDGGPLTLANVVYGKGLGMHAPSEAAFALDARCTRLTALVGVDDEMSAAGSVRFEVWGDGVLLTQTDELTGADAAQPLDVDVTGVRELRLVVDSGEGNGSDHADWANAELVCTGALEVCTAPAAPAPAYPGYQLIWADEFDVDGAPNPENWGFENGFVRNEEAQWYQPDNASVKAGFLLIEGRRERVENRGYRAGSGDWKTSRQFAEYSSASLHSRGKQSFRFGRLEMRARFPAHSGLWPAWWMLGNDGEWPWNGEVDILEFYAGALHANFVVGTDTQWEGNWDAVATPLSALGDADWAAHFHVYRMDWNDTRIELSVDGRVLNELDLSALRNPDGQSPFLNPAYTLINLAIGGQAGGDASAVPFPVRYEVDYVRAFQLQP